MLRFAVLERQWGRSNVMRHRQGKLPEPALAEIPVPLGSVSQKDTGLMALPRA